MKQLLVCFVGIGSIAKRHIRNLYTIAKQENFDIVIDAVSRSGKKREEPIFDCINQVFQSEDELNYLYDAIFITNQTEFHAETLKRVSRFGKNFFIEKPITSIRQIDKIREYKCKDNAVYYVACPLRYNAVIQFIKNNIDLKEVISVRSISSSYLPDWRPGQDYRKTYSAQKELGGGVAIDLIHEWDYLHFLFGKPQKVMHLEGKKSRLEINSEDYAIYIAEYKDKIMELHLDYFGRKTLRTITLFTTDDTIVGDIANNSISYLRAGRTINFEEERDDFQIRELRHFLDMIEGKCEQDSNIEHAISVLQLTQGEI